MNYQSKCTVTIFGEGFFVEEMENGKGKSIFFCEEEKWKREGRKIFGEEKSFVEEKKNGRGKGSKNI